MSPSCDSGFLKTSILKTDFIKDQIEDFQYIFNQRSKFMPKRSNLNMFSFLAALQFTISLMVI